MMKLRQWKRTAAIGLSTVIAVTSLSGCRFGFASDPDDENDTVKEEPIDTSVDTFAYDESLQGTKITLLNSKAEIQVALEKMSKIFEEKAGVHIEVMPVTEGDSPYTKVVSMYNSGNAPTMAILDTTDVKALADEKALVLDEEDWVKEAGNYATEIQGHIYSLPLCVEGKGIIYNKKVIEETLGRDFNPDEINTLDGFKALLNEMRDAGMEKPVSLAKEDWSLGAHHLQYLYETYDGTSDGAAKAVEDLENGQLKVKDYQCVSQLLDLFDVLKEYNVAQGDPLGADYDEMAIDLVDGKTAFWFNGNWAWPNMQEAGAKSDDEYGFLPYFLNNDPDDFVNTKIQAAPSKQVMLDGQQASKEQQDAAKEFLNWIVFSEIGQQMLVKTCNLIPAFKNNPNEPLDPLSRDIFEKVQTDQTYNAAAVVPNDHWSVLGAAMQKYLADRCDREELMDAIQNYWDEQ